MVETVVSVSVRVVRRSEEVGVGGCEMGPEGSLETGIGVSVEAAAGGSDSEGTETSLEPGTGSTLVAVTWGALETSAGSLETGAGGAKEV